MTRQINLANYTYIKIGPTISVEVIESIKEIDDAIFLLGGGNNLLISDNPPKMAMLDKTFSFIYEQDHRLHIGGATSSGKILSFAKQNNLAHFELMQKLPGTLGGMVKMNAGLKEWEVFNHLIAIRTSAGWTPKADIDFGYRFTNIKSVIYEATFEIHKGFDDALLQMFKMLRDNQPKLPSAGSCFKNPPGNFAAKLLDDAGLKGHSIGNMGFSQKHANFLVNLGGGTFEEATTIIEFAKKRVFEHSGVQLELEIVVV